LGTLSWLSTATRPGRSNTHVFFGPEDHAGSVLNRRELVLPFGRRQFGEKNASWNRLAAAIALAASA
jgi:hypothetical protein